MVQTATQKKLYYNDHIYIMQQRNQYTKKINKLYKLSATNLLFSWSLWAMICNTNQKKSFFAVKFHSFFHWILSRILWDKRDCSTNQQLKEPQRTLFIIFYLFYIIRAMFMVKSDWLQVRAGISTLRPCYGSPISVYGAARRKLTRCDLATTGKCGRISI